MSHLLIQANARRIPLASGTAHCVVTSPPFWGLRDYGTAQWVGGDPACTHTAVRRDHKDSEKQATSAGTSRDRIAGEDCRLCGATRIDGQIGLEETPAEYVASLVAVFREVWRVLRDDGTVFLNLGDSYAGSWGNQGRTDERGTQRPINGPMMQNLEPYPKRESHTGTIPVGSGLKPKDLVGIPWRVAFALQADGWYLRSDIIWAKPSPMPESVTDRPTKSHEYLFLLAKNERYYYDADAIKEKAGYHAPSEFGRKIPEAHGLSKLTGNMAPGVKYAYPETRNKRDVWTIAATPFAGAHFATFPPKLIEPCVKAGSSEKGCCATCGAPLVRVTEREPMQLDRSSRTHDKGRTRSSGTMIEPPKCKTLAWAPSCACPPSRPVPCVVLDPFGGAMTTVVVAEALGRVGIATELSRKYLAIGRRRIDRPHARPVPVERPDVPLPLFDLLPAGAR